MCSHVKKITHIHLCYLNYFVYQGLNINNDIFRRFKNKFQVALFEKIYYVNNLTFPVEN